MVFHVKSGATEFATPFRWQATHGARQKGRRFEMTISSEQAHRLWSMFFWVATRRGSVDGRIRKHS